MSKNKTNAKSAETLSSSFEKTLKEELIGILNSQKIPYRSVRIIRDDGLDTILGIKWDEKDNFRIAYTRFIFKLEPEEIKSLLKHEISHFLSIGTTKIHTIRAAEEYVKYVMIFREFLAHKEFIKRFGIDKGLTSFHRRNIKYFEVLIKKAKSIKKVSSLKDHQQLLYFFFSILYDAIYFFVMKDNSFKTWCRKRRLSALYQVYEWIYEDMEYFYGLDMGQVDKERLVQLAAIFPISIDMVSLFQKNHIKVMKELFETYDPQVHNVAEKWVKRLSES